jgi:hypothetical protein
MDARETVSRPPRDRGALIGCVVGGALAVVGGFVFWHSGGRADALCLHERFVSWGSLSLWPPGAQCSFGEPVTHDTFLSPWFVGTTFVLLPLAALTGEWVTLRVRSRARARATRAAS